MKLIIPDTITEEEFIKIIKVVRKPSHKLGFLLGFYQAMRLREVTTLDISNIDFPQKLVKIKHAKGNKDRHIPIIKPLLMGSQEVLRALKQLPVTTGARALEIAIKKYGKEVLGKDIHFHTLRHSGATWLLNKKKWDIRQVQKFLGHAKIQTTEIYTHVSPQDLVELEWN